MTAQNKNTSQSTLKNEELLVSPAPLKIIFSWRAPERLFKKREQEYFTTLGAIIFLLVIILLFLKEWFLIMTIIALTFVSYILAVVKPGETEHKITNRGIVSGGRNYGWDELGRFWFAEKWGQSMLQVEKIIGFPRRLTLFLGEAGKEEIKKILSNYLLLEEPEKTWIDKAGEWLSAKIPLEK